MRGVQLIIHCFNREFYFCQSIAFFKRRRKLNIFDGDCPDASFVFFDRFMLTQTPALELLPKFGADSGKRL